MAFYAMVSVAPDPGKMPIRYFRQAYILFGTTRESKAAILADTGITQDVLDTPDALIPVSAQLQQVRNISALVGEDFTLKAKTVWRPASQGALDIAFRASPNIGEGLQNLAAYAWVRAPQIRVDTTLNENGMTLSILPVLELPLADWRPVTEIVMLSLQAMLESIWEEYDFTTHIDHIIYSWPWSPPDYANQFDKAFYGSNRFNAKSCNVYIPIEITSLASPFADKTLLKIALAQLKEAKQESLEPKSLVDQIKDLLATHEPQSLKASDIAMTLSISLRSLNRQLNRHGTTFMKLRDEDLKQRAKKLITETTLSRDIIADQLGYNDAASLSRSCRRWFGKSLRAIRRNKSAEE